MARIEVEVPERYRAWLIRQGGDAARAWLDDLPALIASCCARWSLTIDDAAIAESGAFVIPVRRGATGAMLKLSWPTFMVERERDGLALWNGSGTVQVLEDDAVHGVLLLERLDMQRHLSSVPIADAATIAGGLVRDLALPDPGGVPLLRDRAAEMVTALPESWERHGQPFARAVLDLAIDLAATFSPRSAPVLANWDMHHDNILAGSRLPWIVIDPMPIVGDPEIAIWPMVLRRLDDIADAATLDAFIAGVVVAGELDAARARAWTTVRAVDYWLWGLDHGLTEDPVRCATALRLLGHAP